MYTFALLNWLAMFVCLFIIAVMVCFFKVSRKYYLLFLYVICVCLMLTLGKGVRVDTTLNFALLIISLTIIFCQPKSMKYFRRNLLLSSKSIFFPVFLSILLIIIYYNNYSFSWYIHLSLLITYFLIFYLINIIEFVKSIKVKFLCTIFLCLIFVFIFFKLLLLVLIGLLINEFIYKRKIVYNVSLLIFLISFIFFNIFFNSENLGTFLEMSLFRPNYNIDTKIFSFSDGGRLNIWEYYLNNTLWFGKSGIDLADDMVAPHNIFISIANECGFLGVILLGPVLVYNLWRIYKNFSLPFFLFFFASLNLSEVGGLSSYWVSIFVFVPIIISLLNFSQKNID
jgi:hypothetical protein